MTRSPLKILLISAAAAFLLAGAALASTAYENEVTLEAGELFPAVALSGDHYRVADEVATDGKVDFHIAGRATEAVRQKLSGQGWQLTASSTLFGI